MKIKKIAFIFVLILMFSTVYGETTFSMPEINNDSGILFSVTHKHPGEISYNTLFSSDLEKDEEDGLDDEDFPAYNTAFAYDDPVRIYLKEIRN